MHSLVELKIKKVKKLMRFVQLSRLIFRGQTFLQFKGLYYYTLLLFFIESHNMTNRPNAYGLIFKKKNLKQNYLVRPEPFESLLQLK